MPSASSAWANLAGTGCDATESVRTDVGVMPLHAVTAVPSPMANAMPSGAAFPLRSVESTRFTASPALRVSSPIARVPASAGGGADGRSRKNPPAIAATMTMPSPAISPPFDRPSDCGPASSAS